MDIRPNARIVVFSPNWLGDAVMAIPALRVLREAHPDATLAVAARAHLAPLFEMVDGVDEVVALPVARRRRWAGAVADAKRLKEGAFDVAVLLPNSIRSALTARLAGTAERWGYSTDRRSWLLTRSVGIRRLPVTADYADFHRNIRTADYADFRRNKGTADYANFRRNKGAADYADFRRLDDGADTWRGHQVEYYLRLLAGLEYTESPEVRKSGSPDVGRDGSPEVGQDGSPNVRTSGGPDVLGSGGAWLTVPAAARHGARAMLTAGGWKPGDLLVGMAPGAAYGTAKQWLPERFARLAVELAAEGVRTVLVGGAGDVAVCDQIEAATTAEIPKPASHPPIANLTGRTDLRELAAVIAECASFVTNDSGAMHVAAAAGVPVTGIFGPTRERETGPNWFGDAMSRHAIVIGEVPCRPCMLRECPTAHECMVAVAVDQVKAVVMKQLEVR